MKIASRRDLYPVRVANDRVAFQSGSTLFTIDLRRPWTARRAAHLQSADAAWQLSPDAKQLAYSTLDCVKEEDAWQTLTVLDEVGRASRPRARLPLPADAWVRVYPLAFMPRSGGLLVEVGSYVDECRGQNHRGEDIFVIGRGFADARHVAGTDSHRVLSALSPDGRSLAYFADNEGGESPASLHVVSLVSGKTREIKTRSYVIPGGQLDLLWSPNSQALVFTVPGKVRVYMRRSGRVRTLTAGRLPDPRIVGFSQNGDVVAYSGLPHSHVELVSLGTGEHRTIDLPRRQGVGPISGMWAVLG